MRLTIIGSSPAWPNPGSAHAGYLVEASGNGRLLLDCGPGVLSRLRERALLPVDAIAITHFHLDHWGDLVPWCWMSASGRGGSTSPTLFLPPGGTAALADIADFWGHTAMFEGVFELVEYDPARPFAAAGFTVEAHAVEHYGMTAFGFRVDDGDGRVLGYSGDTAPCEALGRIAEGADLFLCEATLADAEADWAPRGHLAPDEALSVATGRVLLTHRPAELPVPDGADRAVDGLVVTL